MRWNPSPSQYLSTALRDTCLTTLSCRLISRSGRSVRLHCTIPTTILSCDTCMLPHVPSYGLQLMHIVFQLSMPRISKTYERAHWSLCMIWSRRFVLKGCVI